MKNGKYKAILLIFLAGTLLLSLPGIADASIIDNIKHGVKTAVHDGVHVFKGAKNGTVRTTRTVKRDAVKDFRDVKKGTKHTAKTVKRGVVKGFKDAKTGVKRTTRTVKRGVINGFKSLKNK
jgi:hypothetical protein